MPKTTEQVDHKAEAPSKNAEDAEWLAANASDIGQLLAGVIRSNLAIAEGQERVAEELQGVRRTLVAMHQGSPIDAVEASEEASGRVPRRERAVSELLELAKLADNEVMKGELEGLASRFSLPPARGDRV